MADSQIQRDPKIQERMDQVQDVTDIMAKNVENSNISNFNNPIRHVHHKTTSYAKEASVKSKNF